MKKCSKCSENKELELFNKSKGNKYGLHNWCKVCQKEYSIAYRAKNKEQIKEQQKKWEHDNKENVIEKKKQYYKANKEKIKKYQKKYNVENKERIKIRSKEYYLKSKERIVKYRENNRENIRRKANIKYKAEYASRTKEQRERTNKNSREYIKRKRDNNDVFRLETNIRRMMRKSFKKKGWKKTSRTQEILGCDFKTLYSHLKSIFEKKYKIPLEEAAEPLHIDHIIPLSTAQSKEDLLKLNHYSNLQYLYASHNLSKNNKINFNIEDLL